MSDAEERIKSVNHRKPIHLDVVHGESCNERNDGIQNQKRTNEERKERNLNLIEIAKQITHKSQSISFISRMYLHHPALLPPPTQPDQEKISIGKSCFSRVVKGGGKTISDRNQCQTGFGKEDKTTAGKNFLTMVDEFRKTSHGNLFGNLCKAADDEGKLRALLLFEDMKGKFFFFPATCFSRDLEQGLFHSRRSGKQLFIELLLDVTPLSVIKLLFDLGSGWMRVEAAYGFTNTRSFFLLMP